MESLFTQIAPVLEQIGTSPNGAVAPGSVPNVGVDTSGSSDSNVVAPALRPIAPKEQPTIKAEDDFSDSFGQLALDEYGHMRWIGGSSNMSLIQSFRALTSSPLHRISPMEEDPHAPGPSVNKLYFPAAVYFGKVQALPGAEEVEFPDRDLADKLIEAFFARFHFLMPIVDKPSFLRRYKNIMDNKDDHVLARSEAAFLSLLFAVFSCAAQLVQDPRLTTGDRRDDGGMGMFYYERALVLQYISHANIQIAHVQCFILLSSFLCSVNCLPHAWILIGQAVRLGQDLGLHRSPRRLLVNSVEKETRRKVWWGLYTLDRMLALALGRPLGINDSDCDVELPVEIDDDHLPQYFSGAVMNQGQPFLMAGSVALFNLYEIGGRVLRQVYALENCKEHLELERKAELQRTVESLDAELTKWCDNLPPVFKSQSQTDEQVSMGAVLCSHYYSVLTTLHRNLLPVKRDQPVTAKSTIKAVSSARSCIRLAPSMKHVVPPSHHIAFFIQHLFSSTVILLLYAMHVADPRAAAAAMEEAKSSLIALEAWEGIWPGARKCKELLAELTDTASAAIAQGSTNKKASVPLQSSSASAPPPVLPRRRSVTITTAPSGSASSGRVVKGRSRRNQSRDPSTSSSRRMAAVSPYRLDSAERARSTSRRRGHDVNDPLDRSNMTPYYQPFSPTSGQAPSSSNSSPASAHLPSPSMSVLDNPPDANPGVSASPFNYTPMSPVQTAAAHYDYEYNTHPNPLSHSNSQPWGGSEDPRSLDMYSNGPSETTLYPNTSGTYGYTSPIDAPFPGYEAISDHIMSGSPPSSFAVSTLPFRGLDYIRNFNPGGYSTSEQDSLWQSFDPGAFGYDPDLPFSLGDSALDIQEVAH